MSAETGAWLRHPSLPARFWNKVEVSDAGCWEWTAARDPWGYGKFALKPERGTVFAHRLAYESLVGHIPPGLTIDHLCRVRNCVNPAHMEPVTVRVNTLRGDSPHAINARKTHCIHGHEFTEQNTYFDGRRRQCRRCNAARARRSKANRAEREAGIR